MLEIIELQRGPKNCFQAYLGTHYLYQSTAECFSDKNMIFYIYYLKFFRHEPRNSNSKVIIWPKCLAIVYSFAKNEFNGFHYILIREVSAVTGRAKGSINIFERQDLLEFIKIDTPFNSYLPVWP